MPKNPVFWLVGESAIHLPTTGNKTCNWTYIVMKKLLSTTIAAIVACIALLVSCTEEEIKPPKDNSGETRTTDDHW